MLNKIHIRNFQSHADSKLELSPGVTAIVGPNNQGKSAVLRAIRKVLRDSPLGTSFIRDGEKQTSVTMDGVERRVRNDSSASANMYVVNGQELVKFGTGVPEEALTLLGVSPPQMFGDEELDLNFYNSIDGLFLMTGKGLASLRGKVLGKITGIDVAQRVIQMASAEEKSINRDIKRLKQDVVDVDTKLAKFDGVDDVQQLLSEVQTLMSDIGKLEAKTAQYERVYEDLRRTVAAHKTYKTVIKVFRENDVTLDVADVEELNTYISVIDYVLTLRSDISKLESVQTVDVDVTEELNTLTSIDAVMEVCDILQETRHDIDLIKRATKVVIPEFDELEDTEDRIKRFDMVYQLATTVTRCEQEQKDVEGDLEAVIAETRELQAKIKVCPTCDREF
jgi:DNA repair protein SbcC/Rad50